VETTPVPVVYFPDLTATAESFKNADWVDITLNGYRRVVLEGVGHFPAREAPEAVSNLMIEHFRAFS
jgi:pimeloyl-ACP methyl ester carboxylesterase